MRFPGTECALLPLGRVARLPPLLRAMYLVWTVAPGPACLVTVLLFADSALTLAVIYGLKLLVDQMTLAGALNSGETGVLQWIWVAAVLAVLAALVKAYSSLLSANLSQTVSDHVESLLNARVATADLARLESPENYDLTRRAMLAGGSRPAQTVVNLFQLAQSGLLLAGMAAMLVTVHWLLVALLAVALVPGTLVRLQQSRILHDWQVRRTRFERRVYYLRHLMTEKSGGKELRIYGLSNFLGAAFDALRSTLREEKHAINRRRMYIELSITLGVTVGFFGVLAWLVHRASVGSGSIGELVLFLMVFMRGQGAVQSLKTSLAALFDDNLYLRSLFEFFSLPDRVLDPANPKPVPRSGGLEMKDVSFAYPGTRSIVLDRVSICVPESAFVAIVGANGSGKSTLIKMLCRLYDPDSGSVRWAGNDVRDFRQEEYRQRIGALFQDFVCFDSDVTDNIRFGDIVLDSQSPKIKDAALAALVEDFVVALPQGYGTHLGRVIEEGVELSHGQWQRVALARALVRDSGLLILDEPTSAMDPTAEARLFSNFREILKGRSALVISHRLSIVRQADYIYMMEGGRIIEEGTHDALLSKGAKYRDLFMAQASAYQLDT